MSEDLTKTMLASLLQNGSSAGVSFQVDGTAILSIMEAAYERGKTEAEERMRQALEKKDREEFISRSEAKKLLGKSDSTLWKWDKAGYLRAIHRGGSVVYRKKDCMDILEGRK